MKPFIKLAAAFVAGMIVCFAWLSTTKDHYAIDGKLMINTSTGESWRFNDYDGSWVKCARD